MSEQETTINTQDPGSSPVVEQGTLISTVEEILPIPEADDVTQDDDKKTEGAAEEAAQPEDKKEEDKLDRFDKHPRFQQLLSGNQELKAKIEEMQANLTQSAAKDESTDMSMLDMDDDAILDSLNEKPKEFIGNLKQQIYNQIKSEMEAVQSQKSEEERIHSTLNSYVEKNPDFDTMWQSGEISKFMSNNPGHNAISAHMAMTSESKMQQAIEAARKEAREEVLKQVKAKQGARVLGSGPSAGRSTGPPPEMKDPKKYGGITSVLASRSAMRRRSA